MQIVENTDQHVCREIQTATNIFRCQIFELRVPIFIYFKYLFNDVLHLFFKRIESIKISEIVVSFEM